MTASHTTTERVIREQFPFWRTAPLPPLAEAGTTYAMVGCGTSVHVADSIAVTLCHAGFTTRAVAGNEWALRPGDYLPMAHPHVVALSRSGESTETVAAAQASRARGWPVLAVTCTPGSALTRHADHVTAADTHPAEDIVMTASASLMLLTGLRFAGVTVDAGWAARAAEAAMRTLDAQLGAAPTGRSHFVFLGGGALYGIAREGALKLQEMSLSFTEAHHPMEYRHGPVSLIDERSFVTMLYHPDTVQQETVLVAELQAKGAFVLGCGGPGDISLPLPPDPATRPLLVLPALQLLGERVALARGLLTAVFTFRSFDPIGILTGGGPHDATTTIIVDIYRTAFGRFRFGEGAACTVVICLLQALPIALYMRNMARAERRGPGLVVIAATSFIGAYAQHFLFSLTFNARADITPISVGLFQFFGRNEVLWNELMAASLVSVLPVLFRQAGLDPEQPPRTWQELYDAAKAIKDKTGVAGYGLPAQTNRIGSVG